MEIYKSSVSKFTEKFSIRTALVTDLQCSIARDCLQAERSLLLYCKFAATLGFVSLAVLLDYRFGDAQVGKTDTPMSSAKKFSIAVAIIFFCLSMGSLILGVFNYFNNVYHFVNEKTRTGSKVPTNVFLSLVVLALLAVNISFLVDAYK